MFEFYTFFENKYDFLCLFELQRKNTIIKDYICNIHVSIIYSLSPTYTMQFTVHKGEKEDTCLTEKQSSESLRSSFMLQFSEIISLCFLIGVSKGQTHCSAASLLWRNCGSACEAQRPSSLRAKSFVHCDLSERRMWDICPLTEGINWNAFDATGHVILNAAC